MSVEREIQKARIKAVEHQKVLLELNQLATDIARCERTIGSVMTELESANAKYKGLRLTRQEVEYLTILLDCAKKKLAWEKQIASLQKRAPALMEKMSGILGDREHPPTEELKAAMLQSLQSVQQSLARLQQLDPPAP